MQKHSSKTKASREPSIPAESEDSMTRQQMYRELERLYANVDWSDKDSIKQYNEKAREYRKMVEEEEEND